MLLTNLKKAGALIVMLLFVPFWGTSMHNTQIQKQQRASNALHTITVDVTLNDYLYKPQKIKIQAGHKVVLNFTNKGTVEHEFMAGKKVTDDTGGFKTDLFKNVEVKKSVKEKEEYQKERKGHAEEGHSEEMGEHGEEEHPGTMIELEPGQTGTMKFTLPSSKVGTWEMGCFEETGSTKHYTLGMKGMLVVNPE